MVDGIGNVNYTANGHTLLFFTQDIIFIVFLIRSRNRAFIRLCCSCFIQVFTWFCVHKQDVCDCLTHIPTACGVLKAKSSLPATGV